MLNILDELVLQGSIKQDIITVVGVYQGGRESEDENEAQGQDNIPVETKKKRLKVQNYNQLSNRNQGETTPRYILLKCIANTNYGNNFKRG